jgi:hypothetical protein
MDLNRLVERWDEIVAQVRATRPMLASALAAALPTAVSGRGEITLALDEGGDVYEQPIVAGAAQLLAAVQSLFPAATRVSVRREGGSAEPSAGPERLTVERVKEERLAALRKRDPVLDAAVQALDLELLD